MKRSNLPGKDSPAAGPSATAVFFSLLVTLVLFLSFLCAEICVYMNGLANVSDLPSVWNISDLWLTRFFSSPLPAGCSTVFAVLALLLLFLINGRAVRSGLFFCGIAFLLCGLANGVLAFSGVLHVSRLPCEFQPLLVDSARALYQLAILCAFFFTAVSALMFSIYGCICVIRRMRVQ